MLDKMKKDVEKLILTGKGILKLTDWKIKIIWEQQDAAVGCRSIRAVDREVIFYCNQCLLETDELMKRLISGIVSQLADLAVADLTTEIDEVKKNYISILSHIINY